MLAAKRRAPVSSQPLVHQSYTNAIPRCPPGYPHLPGGADRAEIDTLQLFGSNGT